MRASEVVGSSRRGDYGLYIEMIRCCCGMARGVFDTCSGYSIYAQDWRCLKTGVKVANDGLEDDTHAFEEFTNEEFFRSRLVLLS